jgi:hypothetical protein
VRFLLRRERRQRLWRLLRELSGHHEWNTDLRRNEVWRNLQRRESARVRHRMRQRYLPHDVRYVVHVMPGAHELRRDLHRWHVRDHLRDRVQDVQRHMHREHPML